MASVLANCGACRIDRLEVAGAGERDELGLFAGGLDVALAHLVRDAVVGVAVDHDLARAQREQLQRRAVGEVLRSHVAAGRAVRAAALDGVANIGDRRESHDREAASLRRPQRELAAGRVPDEDGAAVVVERQLLELIERLPEIFWPPRATHHPDRRGGGTRGSSWQSPRHAPPRRDGRGGSGCRSPASSRRGARPRAGTARRRVEPGGRRTATARARRQSAQLPPAAVGR